MQQEAMATDIYNIHIFFSIYTEKNVRYFDSHHTAQLQALKLFDRG